MLNYMRGNAAKIVTVTVVLFLVSLFGIGSMSFFNKRGRNSANIEKPINASIGIINNIPINEKRYNQHFNQFLGSVPKEKKILLDPDLIDYYKYESLQKTITFMLVISEAKKQGIKALSQEVKMRLDQFVKLYKVKNKSELKSLLSKYGITWSDFKQQQRDEILFAKFINGITSRVKVSATDREMAFTKIKASHILVKIDNSIEDEMQADLEALKKAETIYERVLANKGRFSEIAKRYSDDKVSAKNGGQLGWITRGQMVPEFERYIYKMKPGDVGGPIKTIFGYHIIYVQDREDGAIPEGMTEKQINAQVLEEKQNEAVQKWLKPLKEKAEIELTNPALKAYEFRTNEKYEDALIEYQKLLAKDSNNYLIYIQIARMLRKLGRIDEAEIQYRSAFVKQKLNPRYQYPILYFAAVDFYLKQNQEDKAVKYLELASKYFANNQFILEYILNNYEKHLSKIKVDEIKMAIADIITAKEQKDNPSATTGAGPIKIGE